jgi:NTE family protein
MEDNVRALVLSGGGSKGAFQVGVLKKWVIEDHISYDAFCGISVGAINASFLAQYSTEYEQDSVEDLVNLWSAVNDSKIKRNWPFFGILASLWKKSAYDSTPLQKWIASAVNQSVIVNSGKKLRVVATSLDTEKSYVANETNKHIVSWVMASSAFPVMLSPIIINNEQWADGGLRSVTPLGEAIRLGADSIDIILCSNPDSPAKFDEKSAAVPGRLLRSIDIMGAQIEASDLKICQHKNELSTTNPKHRKVNLRIVKPKSQLISNCLSFDPKEIERIMQLGYEAAHGL